MPSKDELDQLYAKPHQHTLWADHRVRVSVSIALAQHMIRSGATVADLSCGDAAIARALIQSHGAKAILGDYAPGYEYTGPIEQTINKLRWKEADLFICSETIEHLDDPDAVLRVIRQKADTLLLSTPDGEDNNSNPEHVWGWDAAAVAAMLTTAGFAIDVHTTLDLRPAGYMYSYQIWAAH
jgi:2-polyprenyl-3-methyl-5-hydroxy-6-metoxy-1,4-benzoquinol methylase